MWSAPSKELGPDLQHLQRAAPAEQSDHWESIEVTCHDRPLKRSQWQARSLVCMLAILQNTTIFKIKYVHVDNAEWTARGLVVISVEFDCKIHMGLHCCPRHLEIYIFFFLSRWVPLTFSLFFKVALYINNKRGLGPCLLFSLNYKGLRFLKWHTVHS